MRKIIFTVIILFFLSSISVSANNNLEKKNTVKYIKIDSKNKTSYLTKYQFIKTTSIKSKMNTVQNFLKDPEKEKIITTAIC